MWLRWMMFGVQVDRALERVRTYLLAISYPPLIRLPVPMPN